MEGDAAPNASSPKQSSQSIAPSTCGRRMPGRRRHSEDSAGQIVGGTTLIGRIDQVAASSLGVNAARQ